MNISEEIAERVGAECIQELVDTVVDNVMWHIKGRGKINEQNTLRIKVNVLDEIASTVKGGFDGNV